MKLVGIVNDNREAIVKLSVRAVDGQSHEVVAVIDTGFNGYLTMPRSLIATLGCAFNSKGFTVLADGSVHFVDLFVADVEWGSVVRSVEVECAETEPLIGMALMEGYKLTIEDEPAGSVTIESFARSGS